MDDARIDQEAVAASPHGGSVAPPRFSTHMFSRHFGAHDLRQGSFQMPGDPVEAGGSACRYPGVACRIGGDANRIQRVLIVRKLLRQ
jgi:hypothetical protein